MHTASQSLDRLAFSATMHCLTGCVIGEVSGMVIGNALRWSDLQTIALAVTLAFIFGYTLTARPLIGARLAFGTVITTALASDTISITIMEVVDNLAMLLVAGAMDAGLDSPLFWGTLAGGLALAFPVAFAANRYLIRHGLGHARVHQYHDARNDTEAAMPHHPHH